MAAEARRQGRRGRAAPARVIGLLALACGAAGAVHAATAGAPSDAASAQPAPAPAATSPASSGPDGGSFAFTGTRTVSAVTADGQRLPIASLQFSPAADGRATFALRWHGEAFSDHFLSMREFKCLAGGPELTCQVPYPYAHPARVGPGDLAWLEHSLLFFHKGPKDFGAKLWNGIYFELRVQGNTLVGRPAAVDLNEISAPPRDPSVPPFAPAQRHALPEQARWVRALVID